MKRCRLFTNWGNGEMNKYSYCVNTFDKDGNVVQLSGKVESKNANEAIQKLIDDNIISSRGYEFLELEKIKS